MMLDCKYCLFTHVGFDLFEIYMQDNLNENLGGKAEKGVRLGTE